MNLNKKALERIRSLNDEELAALIRSVAAEAGVDSSRLSLSQSELASLRSALAVASIEDVARLAQQFGIKKK